MISLVDKILICHQAMQDHSLPHAFGGALALAWCTESARGTIDIDVNLFVSIDRAEAVFDALPDGVSHSEKELKVLIRDTQIRLWWESTPLDMFLNSTPYHEELNQRISWESFAGHQIPFLCCRDLAVFKAFFNRTKDWADLEAMHEAGTLDIRFVTGVLAEYLGLDDERLSKLQALPQPSQP